MPCILDGGVPTTTLYNAISTTPLLVAANRNGNTGLRSCLVIQNVGTVPVYIGGADVAASGARTGLVLVAVADPTVDQPASISLATTGHAVYAVVASGTGAVAVYEEVYQP